MFGGGLDWRKIQANLKFPMILYRATLVVIHVAKIYREKVTEKATHLGDGVDHH
jgi:hypothetical protein